MKSKKQINQNEQKNKNLKLGFTLLELLVVVLIIGILAAVALPHYNKAILKVQLKKGMLLVESLFQAQQSYFLMHGTFATDIDELEITAPINYSCKKIKNYIEAYYQCDFGQIGLRDSFSNVQYQPSGGKRIAYLHFFKDTTISGVGKMKAGEIWCFAGSDRKISQEICEDLGGQLTYYDSSLKRYKVR